MPQFRSKPATIDAEQFTDEANPPRGVLTRSNALTGEAVHSVHTAQSQHVRVHLGEWIVAETLVPDRYYPVEPQTFAARYEPVEA